MTILEEADSVSHRPAWCRFYLADRSGRFNPILHAGRLLHQFVVDAWASCEENMLSWCEQNQSTLRADLYSGSVLSYSIQPRD
jgi:hypothetical protein